MILLFTSYHCTWCDVVRRMVDDESENIGGGISVFEINVEEHPALAKVYNVLVVPTLVSGRSFMSGVPSETDLRSLVLQSVSSRTGSDIGLQVSHSGRHRKSRLVDVESRVLDMMGVEDTRSSPRKTSSRDTICERTEGQSRPQ